MEISDKLLCLFSAQVEKRGDSYHLEIPEQELQVGDVQRSETYRIAVFSSSTDAPAEQKPPESAESSGARERASAGADGHSRGSEREYPGPPVAEGERRTVEIEHLGDQGDGIARVERGFVVIVPETDQGERVTAEITDVRENVAFAEVVERLSYYD